MQAAKEKRLADTFIFFGLILSVLGLALFPSDSVSAAKDGLKLGVEVILPSLFPFFVISSVMIGAGTAERLGSLLSPFLGKLLKTGSAGASAFVIGLTGGYPMGAKAVAELYENGSVSKNEAERLLGFVNNSGPAFILGACGAGVFGSARAGFILLVSHVLSAAAVGIMIRGGGGSDSPKPPERDPFPAVFVKAVKSSVGGILDVCGFVVFFRVMSSLMTRLGLVPGGMGGTVIRGIAELTSGVFGLSGYGPLIAMPLASLFIGWGGLCVHCQALSFILPAGLGAGKYFLGKLLHALISSLFTLGICLIIYC